MSYYYEVKISAENQAQADTILNSLLEKRLVTGGQFIGPTYAKFAQQLSYPAVGQN